MKEQCPDCASGGVFGVGNGKCSKCYGGGKAGTIADDIAGGKPSCPRCHGTGQCPTCGGSGLVSGSAAPARPHAHAELNPFDDKVAVRVYCPKCGALDWFEWRFLGKLTDPVCGHTWYVGSGTYTLMQLRAGFAAGHRFAKYLTSGVSGEGAWIAKAMGWFMGVILGLGIRLEFGVLMIPIQALAGLFQAKKAHLEVATRLVVLALSLAGLGIGLYEAQHASRPHFQRVQPSQSASATGPADYVNARFGYTVRYPFGFRALGESANGDGQEFVSLDGTASLKVWGEDNTLHQSLDEHLHQHVGLYQMNVTYMRRGKDFYILSGTSGDNILYQRATLKNNVFWVFLLTYKQHDRRQYDRLPGQLTKAFVIPR